MTASLTLTKSPANAGFRGTPGRVLALVVGLPIMLAAAGWTAFTVVGLLARTSEHHQASYAWSGGSISLNLGDGDVQIRAVDARVVDVAYTEHYELKRPVVRASSSAAGISLTGKCASGALGGNCSINYVITVPQQAPLHVRHGDGSLTLAGVSAPVDVRAGDGSITGSQLTSKEVALSSGDGHIDLQWSTAPLRVTSSSGDGDVTITVPHGSGPYAIRHSGSTVSDIRVATDSVAKDSMVLHAGDGRLLVWYGS
jgi:hypothetical protein